MSERTILKRKVCLWEFDYSHEGPTVMEHIIPTEHTTVVQLEH